MDGPRNSLGAIAAGVFAVWHRLLNDLARRAIAAASGVRPAFRRTRSGMAESLKSVAGEAAQSSRRAVVDTVEVTTAIPVGIFATWRRLVATVVRAFMRATRAVAAAARSWVTQWPRVLAYHTDPALALTSEDVTDRMTAAAVGVRAFIFGVLLAGILASAAVGLPAPGIATVLGEALWAAARFAIIVLVVPRGAIDRARLSTVFLAGLLPYAIGATALLRVASLVVSAVLTRRGLLGAGVARHETDLAIGWSFGGQLGAVAFGWIVRAAVTLLAGA